MSADGDRTGPIAGQGDLGSVRTRAAGPAREVLPVLLTTRAGLAEIDASLRDLSDDELRALVERARQRASDLSEDEVAAIIAEGLRATRAHGRP